MKWFKHITSASNDPIISEAEDEFGDAGYIVYFKILEIYGAEFGSLVDGKLIVSQAFVRRKLRKSWTKVEQILSFYQTNGKLIFEVVGKRVYIKIPKFIEISSNWTKRIAPLPTEVPTEVPTAKEVDKKKIIEVEEDKKKKPPIVPSGDFDDFWKIYPKKKSKGQALKTWDKLKKSKQLPELQIILTAITTQKASHDWQKENGDFIPHPSTWLNAFGWEDEVMEHQTKFSKTTQHNIKVGQSWIERKMNELETGNN